MPWLLSVVLALALPSLLLVARPAHGQQVQPMGCTAPEYRAFDFLIGHWRVVHTANGKLMGQNLVEWANLGCAVRETLTFPGRGAGLSVNFYSPIDRRWHGTYHDSLGLFANFEGIAENGRHVVSADVRFPQEPGRLQRVRQSSFVGPSGLPRQIGERWNDEKKAWEMFYDVTFCRLQEQHAEAPCRMSEPGDE